MKKLYVVILLLFVTSIKLVDATWSENFENEEQYLNAPNYYSEDYQNYLISLDNSMNEISLLDDSVGTSTSPVTRTIGVAGYTHTLNGLCGPTCAQIIINYYTGITYTQPYIANLMGTSYYDPNDPNHSNSNPTGTYVYMYTNVLNQLLNGSAVYAYRLNSQYNYFAQLKNNINQSKPFTFDVKAYYVDSRYNTGAMHYILGTGYQETGNLTSNKVRYYDPYSPYAGTYWVNYTRMNNGLNNGTKYYIN